MKRPVNLGRTSVIVLFTCATAVILFSEGCKHYPGELLEDLTGGGDTNTFVPPPDTLAAGVVCDPDTVYFEQVILPLLVNKCAKAGCHDAITHEEGVRLYSYATIRQQVTPGNPNNSDLLTDGIWETGNDHMPPPDEPQPSADQIAQIVTWIQQGAQNNSCVPSACDTTNVTYAGNIAPSFNTFCTGCHGGASPDGGINLTTYAGVLTVVNDGSLAGAIQHQTGFSSMPPQGSGLSACRIEQILNWIQQGAPQN